MIILGVNGWFDRGHDASACILRDGVLIAAVEEERHSGIVVLNRCIALPEPYVNQYVFAKLNLETATLHVDSEHDGVSAEILRQPFPYTL